MGGSMAARRLISRRTTNHLWPLQKITITEDLL
jgi:hypothetical protein